MFFKIFVACALICGLMTYVLAKETISSMGMRMDFLGELYDIDNSNYNWDPYNKVAPPTSYSRMPGGYNITADRLAELRSSFMYWYFDEDLYGGRGDYQLDINTSEKQLHKNLYFELPFYGFRFNYTKLTLNGYLEFLDNLTYPLVFSNRDWHTSKVPPFMGIFFGKCRVGRIFPTDSDQRTPGVYLRVERDLIDRTDRFGVEVRERTKWDIRGGIFGADTFVPKHVIIATWKNVSFAGGNDDSLFTTNTFQMIVATDEVYTYAIFNYADLNWFPHTEAGGESQNMVIRDQANRGWANGFPGRHIFRVDEEITIVLKEYGWNVYVFFACIILSAITVVIIVCLACFVGCRRCKELKKDPETQMPMDDLLSHTASVPLANESDRQDESPQRLLSNTQNSSES